MLGCLCHHHRLRPSPLVQNSNRYLPLPKPESEPSVEIADDLALILSSQLGWPVSFVSLVETVETVETVWPDACLDAPAESEICVEDLTSGFAVTLEADGQCYSYRTDETME